MGNVVLVVDMVRGFCEEGHPLYVGPTISSAPPNDFTADLKEVEGEPVAKRGRIPGVTPNPLLRGLI